MVNLPSMAGNPLITITATVDTRAIGTAVRATRAFATSRALSIDLATRLTIVVEELVTNLVDHGGACGTPFTLRLAMRGGGVAMSLTDRGQPFDPRDSLASHASPERGGGAGLALVMTWAEMLDCRRNGDVNHLRLYLADRSAV